MTTTRQKRGGISEPEKKIVAARQHWKCNICRGLLPATYQIDHVVALVDGGPDDAGNAQAPCPNCHAEKTQVEHIRRVKIASSRSKEKMYEDREYIFVSKTRVVCTLCRRERPAAAEHSVCQAIEDPGFAARCVESRLSKFAFVPGN